MCDNQNNKVLHMMSIALNKPKAKLKKFCKYLSVFEKNISLSPKSITYKINGPICSLPENIRSTILDKFAEILPTKYVLLDWIDKNKLEWSGLSRNPNAIDLLTERIEYENSLNRVELDNLNYADKINWRWLCINPNAIELLTNNQDKIDWDDLSLNPNAIPILEKT